MTMPMLYHVAGYAPESGMGSAGFTVQLWPSWKDAVASYTPAITQQCANRVVETMGRQWLDGHGYNRMTDDDDGNKRHLYEPRTAIRVSWGEWGPEHITVPGNACGLDLSDSIWSPRNGRVLLPHNVDSVYQASLLLAVFLFFADTFVLDTRCREDKQAMIAASCKPADAPRNPNLYQERP